MKGDDEGLVALGLLAVVGMLALGVLLAGTTALLLMIAWNVVVPIFHGPTINFWQALAVSVLLAFLQPIFKRK
jgi:hypothetical protein